MAENRIAVSKLQPNYENWLRKIDSSVEVVDLYTMELDEAMEVARRSTGLLLTGGSDINPVRYGKESYMEYCRNIDEKRDELELLLIGVALDSKIPILGICRGLQVLNVAFKGTLIPDIPEFSKSQTPHSSQEDVLHRVTVKSNTQLYSITDVSDGIVNSSHHQCIDKLGSGLQASAYSPDNLIEAIEADQSVYPFCIAVQWHPELTAARDPLQQKLFDTFVEQANCHRTNRKKHS
jgi:putative glutamine amidotransferase